VIKAKLQLKERTVGYVSRLESEVGVKRVGDMSVVVVTECDTQ
jgi:hypothetical protein